MPTSSRARSSSSDRRSSWARILFEKLELTPGRKGKTGYSTDSKVLRAIRADHEIVPVIEEWRELTKLVNTYLGPLPTLIGDDGRLHTTINQTVAATGRLSTSSPNLQAIPIRTELGREIRSAFVAEPGHRLLSADYSQIELRILAHVSGEPKLREAFARGEDIHTATAAEVLGKDPATLTKDERNVAKMINFGIVYGISAFGLSENLDIPKEQAQAYIDAYLARFPLVQAFIARTIVQASEDGYVTSLLGRRRPVPELRASNRQTRGFGERVAVNFVMQGSNADIIKVAMVAIDERLRAEGRGARLVLQVHDELLLEVPETEVSTVRELVREEMVGAYPLDPAARRRRRRRRRLGGGEVLELERARRPPARARPGTAARRALPREEAVVERLHVHRHDRRHARGHFPDVVDSHDDEPALGELRSAGVHDRDARPVALDRLGDALVPDGVAGEVEVVEHEAADGREQLGHPSRSVPRGRSRDPEPVPLERLHDRPRARPSARSASSSSGWQKTGTSRGRSSSARPSRWSRCRCVTRTASMPANDLLGRERQAARSGWRPGSASPRSVAARPRRRASGRRGSGGPRARRSASRCGRESSRTAAVLADARADFGATDA